jgi:HlyD family secretion protein
MPKSDQLFRPKALERISSPDRLDQLMHVVSAKDWIPIVTLIGLFGVGVAWSVWGSVPTLVNGRGVLLRPSRIVQIQTLGGGRLESFHARIGDTVREGDLLGRVDQPELREKIHENREFVVTLRAQDGIKKAVEDRQEKLQQEQDRLERRFLEAQRKNLEAGLADARALHPALERRLESLTKAESLGLTAPSGLDLVTAQSSFRDNDARISDYTARLEQIDGQLKQIETRFGVLVQEHTEASIARQNQISDLQNQISMGGLQLTKSAEIRGAYAGTVTEVFAASGQVLAPGARLISLDIEDGGAQPLSVSYFPVRDGKRIRPGMRIQVTPDTVDRERFGGIVGKVLSVSRLPVTKEGAMNTVGNPEIVSALMGDGAYIEVTTQLETDPSTFSGYRWSSSRGPQLKMTSGVTTISRVTVESRAPITYLIPILRESSGVY